MADNPYTCAHGDCPAAFETAAQLASHAVSAHGGAKPTGHTDTTSGRMSGTKHSKRGNPSKK